MKFEEFAKRSGGGRGISRIEAEQILGITPSGVKAALKRWIEKGLIIRLRRDLYALNPIAENPDTFDRDEIRSPGARFASVIRWPSYLTGAWALAFHGLMESRDGITDTGPNDLNRPTRPTRPTRPSNEIFTSVTLDRPGRIENALGLYLYKRIERHQFVGFSPQTINRRLVLIAEPEKALVDHLHITRISWTATNLKRIGLRRIETLDLHKVWLYARLYHRRRIYRAVRLLSQLNAGRLPPGFRTVMPFYIAFNMLPVDLPGGSLRPVPRPAGRQDLLSAETRISQFNEVVERIKRSHHGRKLLRDLPFPRELRENAVPAPEMVQGHLNQLWAYTEDLYSELETICTGNSAKDHDDKDDEVCALPYGTCLVSLSVIVERAYRDCRLLEQRRIPYRRFPCPSCGRLPIQTVGPCFERGLSSGVAPRVSRPGWVGNTESNQWDTVYS